MSVVLNPYLTFAGTAREAMDFYRSVLGGELQVMTYGDQGGPPDIAEQVMHAQLTTPDGQTLMGSDAPPGQPAPAQNVAVSLSGDDADRLRGFWQQLSDGGTVQVPLEKQMWGDEFGTLVDRHGVSWLMNISGT